MRDDPPTRALAVATVDGCHPDSASDLARTRDRPGGCLEAIATRLARALDRRGASLEAIATRLARRGFAPAVIGAALSRLPPRSRRAQATSPRRRWLTRWGPSLLL